MTYTAHEEQLELEEQLKRANPKGHLWEACAKRGIAPPKIHDGSSGTGHCAWMQLDVGEWELDSGEHWGSSRKVAEQLAARALLDELLEVSSAGTPPESIAAEQALGDEVFDVVVADVPRLRQSNPKGQVYEWCQKQRPPVRRPRFEARRTAGQVVVRGRLDTLSLVSPWFRSKVRKEAEQAAAEALLHLLPESEAGEPIGRVHPGTVLNDLVNQKQLAFCQVEVTGQRGAPHERLFTAQGRVTLPSGEKLRTGPFEGSTKREAITHAARDLLERVTDTGVVLPGR